MQHGMQVAEISTESLGELDLVYDLEQADVATANAHASAVVADGVAPMQISRGPSPSYEAMHAHTAPPAAAAAGAHARAPAALGVPAVGSLAPSLGTSQPHHASPRAAGVAGAAAAAVAAWTSHAPTRPQPPAPRELHVGFALGGPTGGGQPALLHRESTDSDAPMWAMDLSV